MKGADIMGYFEKYNQEEIQQIVQISTSFKDFARKSAVGCENPYHLRRFRVYDDAAA